MDNQARISPPEQFVLEIKKEPKDEYFSKDHHFNQDEPLKSLVLKFVRDKNGIYSVIPFIKPDPFFEENLEDFCHDDVYSLIESEEPEVATAETSIKIEDIEGNYANYNKTEETTETNNIERESSLEDGEITRCDKCVYENTKLKVRRHVLRVHPMQTHPCRFCEGKSFKELLSLDSHILKNHMDVKDALSLIKRTIFTCELCGYQSLKRNNFRRHLLSHGDSKLRNRLLNHGDDDKSSITINESKYEIKMALKKTLYECYHCPLKTKDKGSLVKHVRLHKSVNHMPYTCTLCSLKFNEKKSLDSHIVKNHLENKELLKTVTNRIYECKLCSYTEVNKNKLIRHTRARHVKKEKKS